ncbi:MAG TPA: DUF5362 family protein [Paludibacter sp.]|nr:DUF5362 family protein [Paludibacter sp.]
MANEISNKKAENKPEFSMTLEAEEHLKSAAKWSYFLSIIGFINMVLLVVGSITLFGLSMVKNEYADFQSLPFPVLETLGVLYFVMAILYFYPTYNLMKFGSKIQYAFENHDQAALNQGLKNLKKVFMFIGILTLVSIGMIIIFIISAFLFKHALP